MGKGNRKRLGPLCVDGVLRERRRVKLNNPL